MAGTSPTGIQKTPIRGDYAVPTTGWARVAVTLADDQNLADEREAQDAAEHGTAG